MPSTKKRVVIVGGGFGGLNAAIKLGHEKQLEVILFDRRNYHLFQPLLYQVATAGLSPAEIAAPIRSLLSRYRNIDVRLGNVREIDLPNQRIFVGPKEYKFDYLILACGAKHSYFSHPEWEEFAPGLKTLEQATEIRRRILLAFELAENTDDPQLQKEFLSFIVVGGGPTGVELAGAIAEISRFTLEKDFRKIDPSRTRIILIEAGPRILSSFHESLSKRACRDLEALGVQIWTNTSVTEISKSEVHLKTEVIRAQTILWAAGVKPSSLAQSSGIAVDKSGKILVNQDLSIPKFPHCFAIGDMVQFKTESGVILPGQAPVAIQQGRHVGKNIRELFKGKQTLNFHYFDKGQMATIGRKHAVLEAGKIKLGGSLAWIAWLFIHIYYLVGFKNRLFVILQWGWSYLRFRKGARLILYKEWQSKPNGESD